MRELTSTALVWIVCLYIIIGGLYVCNKDYTGEKAKVSTTLVNNDSDVLYVYVPEYGMHLEMPKKEWSGQDEFILQKDCELCGIVGVYLMIPMVISLAFFIGYTPALLNKP